MSARQLARAIAARVAPSIGFRRRRREILRNAAEIELALIPRFAARGTFVDVGANCGEYLYAAQPYFDRVVAFEPHPGMAATLRSELGGKIDLHEVALSDREGSTCLYVPLHDSLEELETRGALGRDANPGFQLREIQIRTATLDAFALDRVAFIKVDIEGHEAKFLDGAEKTIAGQLPIILMEIEDRHHPGQSHDIMHRITYFGYDIFYWRDGLIAADDIDLVHHQDASKIGDRRAYINNFLFIPAGVRGKSVRRVLAR